MSAIEKEKEKMNRKNCKKAVQQRLCYMLKKNLCPAF